jgi:hypothetical protein
MERTDGDGCTDVLVEAPTRLPLGKGFSSQHPTALLLASKAWPFPLQTCCFSRDRGNGARKAANALTPSNVLRI